MSGTRRQFVFAMWLAAAFTLLCVVGIEDAFARAGGGGSYGGGGGGGGGGSSGGGGGGGGEGLFYLIQFCFRYPLIGIPLLILFVGFMIYGWDKGRDGHISRTIRHARRQQDAQLKARELAEIQQRDPAFDEETFLLRVSNAFVKIQDAWSRQDMASARAFISDGIYERFSLQFEMQKFEGYRNVMKDVDVKLAKAASVHSDSQFDTIHVLFRASATDYRVRLSNGKTIRGSDMSGTFSEYWSFHRRPGAKTLSGPGAIEGNCPNCAAPLQIVDRAQCAACKSIVNSGEHDWVLAEISQESEWSVPAVDQNAPELIQRDPGFSVQHIEDRVSVMFWRMRAAEFFRNLDYARPIMTEERAVIQQAEFDHTEKGRLFWKEAAVGKVEIVDVQDARNDDSGVMDRVRVAVRWSGILSERGEKKIRELQPKRIVTQVYVLIRKPGVQSRPDQAFSSAGCSQCGAPIETSAESNCPFCGATLTDGRYDWVLADIERYTPEMAFNRPVDPVASSNGDVLPSNENANWNLSLAVLARMMHIDGRFDEKEREKIETIGRSRGLNEGQIQAVINTARDGEIEIPVPTNYVEGGRYLQLIIRAALADGKISPEEKKFLLEFGDQAGMSHADVKMAIARERRREFQVAKQLRRG